MGNGQGQTGMGNRGGLEGLARPGVGRGRWGGIDWEGVIWRRRWGGGQWEGGDGEGEKKGQEEG